MDEAVRTAVVVGAGAMGSGIAAHLANAGVQVTLLDVVPDGEPDRSRLARDAIARQVKSGGFMLPVFEPPRMEASGLKAIPHLGLEKVLTTLLGGKL